MFLPPANEVCESYVFTRVRLSTGGGVVAGGMHGRGHGRGVCIRGHAGWGACMAGGYV